MDQLSKSARTPVSQEESSSAKVADPGTKTSTFEQVYKNPFVGKETVSKMLTEVKEMAPEGILSYSRARQVQIEGILKGLYLTQSCSGLLKGL